jgi:hypothetical protein
MLYLSQLLAQSDFYADRKQQGNWKDEKDFDKNLEETQQKKLQKINNPTIIQNLEKIYSKDSEGIYYGDINELYALYYGALSYLPIITAELTKENSPEKEKYQHLKQNVEYLSQYVEALQLGISREDRYQLKFQYINNNYDYIVAVLEHNFQTSGFDCYNFNQQDITYLSYNNHERSSELPISTSTSQNIIYRLAKEFYGYTGKNDPMELMQYYGEGTGHIHGLYYKDGRYINNDRAYDGAKIDLSFLDDKHFATKEELKSEVAKIIKQLLYENVATVSATSLLAKL